MIPFNACSVTEADEALVLRALRERQLSGNGTYCSLLSGKLQSQLDCRTVIPTTSCSAALELAVMVLGLEAGDEVIMPSFSFPSTANAVLRERAVPVFAEIESDTLTIDPEDVIKRITPRTRGVICVHYGGNSADMNRLSQLCAQHKLWLIEDAAQGISASYQGRPLGSIGNIGCLSFHATKNVSCGEGGAFLCNDPKLAKIAELIAEKGTDRAQFLRKQVRHYAWQCIGSNFMLPDILAALALSQLSRLSEIVAIRKHIWLKYSEAFSPFVPSGRIELMRLRSPDEHNGHIFAIIVPPKSRDSILLGLLDQGVQATSHFEPLHLSPYATHSLYGHNAPPSLPITEKIAAGIIRLPIYEELGAADQETVINAVKKQIQTI